MMTDGLKRAVTGLALAVLWSAPPGTAHQLTIKDGHFVLDGQPIQIISGEMHYPRIPREYWRDRLNKARAMGLNTISTYVFWNLHEPKPRRLRLQRATRRRGVHPHGAERRPPRHRPARTVRVRRVGSRRLPAWLLADHSMVLRSNDPKFTAAAGAGSNGSARNWRRSLDARRPDHRGAGRERVRIVRRRQGLHARQRDMIVRERSGRGAALHSRRRRASCPTGTLPDLPAVVNFGPGGAEQRVRGAARLRPGATAHERRVLGGLVRSVGRPARAHQRRQQARETRLDAGAGRIRQPLHVPRRHDVRLHERRQHRSATYQPQTSSYDYDAALDESGPPDSRSTSRSVT